MIGAAASFLSTTPWSLFLLLTPLFGMRLYEPHDKEVCARIQRRFTWTSRITDGGRGVGYACGFWYFGHVSAYETNGTWRYDAWVFCTQHTYERLSKDPTESVTTTTEETPPKTITMLERTGPFSSTWYRRRKIRCSVQPRDPQTSVMKEIMDHYYANGHTVALLHGPPGTGKSMISILLADALRGMFCNTLRPWQPGDVLTDLYNESEPTVDKPLIVSFDEIDVVLATIRAGIPQHKNIPTSVHDKGGWNRMFDSIGRGLLPHLIVVMSTNVDPSTLDAFDCAYLRKGRVDVVCAMT